MAAKSNQTNKFTDAFALFGKSTNVILKNYKVFGLLYIIPLLTTIPGMVKNYILPEPMSLLPFSEAINFVVVGMLFIALIVVMIYNYALLFVAELQAVSKKLTIKSVWKHTKGKVLNLFLLTLLVGFTVVLGLLLFIIPGVIFIRRYFLSPFYLIDKNLGVQEAMRASAKDTKEFSRHVWPVLGLIFVFGAPSLFVGLPTLISFVLTTLYSVAPAILYTEIKKATK